nr:hypothetical protein XF13B_13530 [Bradyrhizobium diazoefficiens]
MRHALDRLRAERIWHKQTSEFQIKVGPYNFYPGKGTIFMDRDVEARPERGLETFISLVCKLRDRNPLVFRDDDCNRDEPCRLDGFDIKEAIDSRQP